MFIKSLLISKPSGEVVREINFHAGLNLIVDETPQMETSTGNNVGKTTVLRLIDVCLGAKPEVVYADSENKKSEYCLVKDFLVKNKILIKLTLVDDLKHPLRTVEITRNFLKYKENVYHINGTPIALTNSEEQLMQQVFPMMNVDKPTFRQMIAHNIRYKNIRLEHTVDILDSYTKLEEYETLYLYLFGCEYNKGKSREELLSAIKTEMNYKNRLEKTATINSYKVAIEDLNREIAKLENRKETLNINPNLKEDMDNLTTIEGQINRLSTQIGLIKIKKNVIEESIQDFKNQRFDMDLSQLRLVYKQASALIPQLHHSFDEMVKYHNGMLENRSKFLSEELPLLEANIKNLSSELDSLRKQEQDLTQRVVSSDTFETFNWIVSEINEKYKLMGSYEASLNQILDVEKGLAKLRASLSIIDKDLFSEEFKTRLDGQLSKFNDVFAEISGELYGERYSLKEDVVKNSKDQSIYKFTVIGNNLSSGKKQGEISCFDIAYTMFADREGIPCLHFLLNDKKELMHDNQLLKLAEICNRQNIQFVASILKDKLPPALQNEKYFVVKLSQDDKLFRI
jgi:uncharacterized protein YydD (DUF2326 family)